MRRCFSASGFMQVPHPHVGAFPGATGRVFAASMCARGKFLKLAMPAAPFFAAAEVLSRIRLDFSAEIASALASYAALAIANCFGRPISHF